jgi:hypothetical protein
MAGGDVLDNAACFQLVGDLSPGPLADGASRFGRGLTGQGCESFSVARQ